MFYLSDLSEVIATLDHPKSLLRSGLRRTIAPSPNAFLRTSSSSSISPHTIPTALGIETRNEPLHYISYIFDMCRTCFFRTQVVHCISYFGCLLFRTARWGVTDMPTQYLLRDHRTMQKHVPLLQHFFSSFFLPMPRSSPALLCVRGIEGNQPNGRFRSAGSEKLKESNIFPFQWNSKAYLSVSVTYTSLRFHSFIFVKYSPVYPYSMHNTPSFLFPFISLSLFDISSFSPRTPRSSLSVIV